MKECVQEVVLSISRRSLALPAIVAVATVIIMNAVVGQEGKHPAPIGNNGQHQKITKSKTPIIQSNVLRRKSSAPKKVSILPRTKPKTVTARAKGDGIGQLLKAATSKKKTAESAKTKLLGDKKIRFVQTRLTQLGYAPGPVDGVMGEKTRDAIKKFEGARQFPVTGEISAALLDALIRKASFASLALT